MKQYRINELMLYREYEQEEDQILQDLGEIINSLEEEEDLAYLDEKERRELYFSCLHRLVEMAGTYGFSGNLWHCYLTYLLVNNENVFSKACEIHGPVEGSINAIALHDFDIYRELFAFDFAALEERVGGHGFAMLLDYTNVNENSKMFNKRIRDRICDLSVLLG